MILSWSLHYSANFPALQTSVPTQDGTSSCTWENSFHDALQFSRLFFHHLMDTFPLTLFLPTIFLDTSRTLLPCFCCLIEQSSRSFTLCFALYEINFQSTWFSIWFIWIRKILEKISGRQGSFFIEYAESFRGMKESYTRRLRGESMAKDCLVNSVILTSSVWEEWRMGPG